MSSESLSSESKALYESRQIKQEPLPSTERMSSPRSSPPSSPPVLEEDASQEMPSATRKRSNEEMNAEATDANDSSTTAVGDADAQTKQGVSSTSVKPSTPAHTMPPPPAPTSSMFPPSQKTPRSGQGSTQIEDSLPQPSTTANTNARKRSGDNIENDSMDEDAQSPGSPTLSDPQDKIEDFDWNDLQQRYHDKIAQLDATEHSILGEFGKLCDCFAVWAQTGSTHEVGRSFKRLKTQMTYVQHHEDELEQKRQHYIKVVDAFKSALDLLVK